jgi:hypothetical protein
MGKILDNNHAEVAPPLQEIEERWYLPLFGVYHPKKPEQIRSVFDFSAKFNGVCRTIEISGNFGDLLSL